MHINRTCRLARFNCIQISCKETEVPWAEFENPCRKYTNPFFARLPRSSLTAAAQKQTMNMQKFRPTTLITLALTALLLQACTQEPPAPTEPVTEAPPPETTTSVYDWHARGVPAGETTIERAGDGRVTTEAFVHWNNREYTVNPLARAPVADDR